MSGSYYRYNTITAAPTLPEWWNMWPGQDGCGDKWVFHSSTGLTQPPSQGQPISYQPEVVTRWKDKSPLSGITRSIPPYRFTTYRIGKKTVKQHLVRRDYAVGGCNRFYQYGDVLRIEGMCIPTPSSVLSSGPVYSTYYELQHEFTPYGKVEESMIREGDIQDALYEVQNEVVASALSSYDALTGLAEMKDVPRLVTQVSNDLSSVVRSLKSRHSLATLKSAYSLTPRQLLKSASKALRKLGDDWMGYRYGLMPLVYSYRDLKKSLDRGIESSNRCMRVISPVETGQSRPSYDQYLVYSTTGSVTVRGEIFQYFDSDEIARLSSLGVNPLVTAWELIPYSFVFDWFVDVGTYVASKTSQTWAQQKWACLSRRDQTVRTTAVHLPDQSQTVQITNLCCTGWVGDPPAATPDVVTNNPAGDFPLVTEEIDSYSRWTIPVSAAPLRYNPNLSWRRLIDGAVLSLNQLGRLYRSLR